jgi:hypothetical protein
MDKAADAWVDSLLEASERSGLCGEPHMPCAKPFRCRLPAGHAENHAWWRDGVVDSRIEWGPDVGGSAMGRDLKAWASQPGLTDCLSRMSFNMMTAPFTRADTEKLKREGKTWPPFKNVDTGEKYHGW